MGKMQVTIDEVGTDLHGLHNEMTTTNLHLTKMNRTMSTLPLMTQDVAQMKVSLQQMTQSVGNLSNTVGHLSSSIGSMKYDVKEMSKPMRWMPFP